MNIRNYNTNNAIEYLLGVIEDPIENGISRPNFKKNHANDIYIDANENLNDVVDEYGLVAKVRALPNGYNLKKKIHRNPVKLDVDAVKEGLAHFMLMSSFSKVRERLNNKDHTLRAGELLNGKYLNGVFIEPKAMAKRIIEVTDMSKDQKSLSALMVELAQIKEDGEKKFELKKEIDATFKEYHEVQDKMTEIKKSKPFDSEKYYELMDKSNVLVKKLHELQKNPLFENYAHKIFFREENGVMKKYDISYEDGAYCVYYLLDKKLSPQFIIDGKKYNSFHDVRSDPANYGLTSLDIYSAMRNSLSHNKMSYKNGYYTHKGSLLNTKASVTFKKKSDFEMIYSSEWLELFNEQILKLDYKKTKVDGKLCYKLSLPTFVNVEKGYHPHDDDTEEQRREKLHNYLSQVSFVSVVLPPETEQILVDKVERYLNDMNSSALKKKELRTTNQREKYLEKDIFTRFGVEVDIHFEQERVINKNILNHWEDRISKVRNFAKCSNDEQNDMVKDFILANPEYCATGENFKIVSKRTEKMINDFLNSYDSDVAKNKYLNNLFKAKENHLNEKCQKELEEYMAHYDETLDQAPVAIMDDDFTKNVITNKGNKSTFALKDTKNINSKKSKEADRDVVIQEKKAELQKKYATELEEYKEKMRNKKLKGFSIQNLDIIDNEMVAFLTLFKTYMNIVDNGLCGDMMSEQRHEYPYSIFRHANISSFDIEWKRSNSDVIRFSHILNKLKNAICHDRVSLELSENNDPFDNVLVIHTEERDGSEAKLMRGDIRITVGELLEFVDHPDMINYDYKEREAGLSR